MECKFALTGVHGGGKTTLLSKIASELSDRGISCAGVSEVARMSPYPTGIDTTFQSQSWMFTSQLRQELIASDSDVQVVLCDRTLLDNVIYMRRFVNQEDIQSDNHMKIMRAMHRLAMNWMSTYDHVVRLMLNLEWLLERDKEKGTVEELTHFANEIEREFDNYEGMYVDNVYSEVPLATDVADLIEVKLHR